MSSWQNEKIIKDVIDEIETYGGIEDLHYELSEIDKMSAAEIDKVGSDDNYAKNLLMVSMELSDSSFFKELLKKGCDIRKLDITKHPFKTSNFDILLNFAIEKKQTDIFLKPVHVFYHFCKGNGNLDICEKLVEYCDDVNHVSEHGTTLLMAAAKKRDGEKLVRSLLNRGAKTDIFVKGKFSRARWGEEHCYSALSLAITNKNYQSALLLIDAVSVEELNHVYNVLLSSIPGLNENTSYLKETLLIWTIRNYKDSRDSTIAIEMIRKKCDLNIADGMGITAFDLACQGRHYYIANELLKAGCDPTIANMRPLYNVCWFLSDESIAIKIIDAYIAKNDYSFLVPSLEREYQQKKPYYDYASDYRQREIIRKTQMVFMEQLSPLILIAKDALFLIIQYIVS